MPVTATNRYMNATATFGGTALGGLKSFQYNPGLETLTEGADFNLYPTVSGVTMANPSITLRLLDAFAGAVPTINATGSLVVTVGDFKNGVTASGGGKTVTMTGAYLSSQGADAEYRQLATQTVSFHAASTDGVTSPVAIAAL